MGLWTLENISATSSALDGPVFGTNFKVKLKLKYVGGTFTSWSESPMLDWHEKFVTLWHHKKQYWDFEANMFDHKPGSPTFQAWSRRYSEAYNFVTGQAKSITKGSVSMYDVNGKALAKDALGIKPGLNAPQKAEAVRAYLKSKGGILEVEVHDIPGIGTTGSEPKHVERLLLFDCGLVGGNKRVKAMQYLKADNAVPASTWTREFAISSFSRVDQNTHGLTKIPTPADVGTPNRTLLAGEYK